MVKLPFDAMAPPTPLVDVLPANVELVASSVVLSEKNPPAPGELLPDMVEPVMTTWLLWK